MPTDTEIWERACEKAGLGVKPNQKAYCPEHGRACIGDEGCCCANKHQRFPAIGDPAAVNALEEWTLKSLCVVHMIWSRNEGYSVRLEFADMNYLSGFRPTRALALASAVLAVPQETQP